MEERFDRLLEELKSSSEAVKTLQTGIDAKFEWFGKELSNVTRKKLLAGSQRRPSWISLASSRARETKISII